MSHTLCSHPTSIYVPVFLLLVFFHKLPFGAASSHRRGGHFVSERRAKTTNQPSYCAPHTQPSHPIYTVHHQNVSIPKSKCPHITTSSRPFPPPPSNCASTTTKTTLFPLFIQNPSSPPAQPPPALFPRHAHLIINLFPLHPHPNHHRQYIDTDLQFHAICCRSLDRL